MTKLERGRELTGLEIDKQRDFRWSQKAMYICVNDA